MSSRSQKLSNKNILAIIIAALILVAIGYGVYRISYQAQKLASNSPSQSNTKPAKTIGQNNPQSPAPASMQYSSSAEGASFQYPANWKLTKPVAASPDPSNSDHYAITSPSGNITISYVTNLVGFGNETTSNYPLETVIDKSAISGASGLYVVSGTTTLDGTIYYPWIAVQDSGGITSSGVKGDLATFTARRALNPSTQSPTRILFATCGARTTQDTPALSLEQADDWFTSSEAQQAKQIMLSFVDPE